MKPVVSRAVLFAVCLLAPAMALPGAEDQPTAVYGRGAHALAVATGSPGELGLLEALAEPFSKAHDTIVHWYKAGSGESLALLKERQVDVALVHSPEAERRAVAQGWAARRTPIGSNEFDLVGPKNDPARVAGAKSMAEAYARIANAEAPFYSRGDGSGTHKREMAIWERAGVRPEGAWYRVSGDFMLATLAAANRENAYFMTDSSTWVAARAELGNLRLLFQGDPLMRNAYHGLCRPEEAGRPRSLAAGFLDFVASQEGQAIVRDYGKDRYGEALYRDARSVLAVGAEAPCVDHGPLDQGENMR